MLQKILNMIKSWWKHRKISKGICPYCSSKFIWERIRVKLDEEIMSYTALLCPYQHYIILHQIEYSPFKVSTCEIDKNGEYIKINPLKVDFTSSI